jgi:sulfate adenylyltransferase subunit 1
MAQVLRLATAGSVDDGKSTLVGRLLYDTKSVLADQIDAVRQVSAGRGTAGLDLSLLVDGLRSEREQGITIDVAYRYFATPRRSFVLADTPGHVQYTRNTVTGATTAQLGLLLVDARKGVAEQTRRHATVFAMLGVPQLVLAVNKIDLVDFDEAVYAAATERFLAYMNALGYRGQVVPVPVSALLGDNVTSRSARTPWYDGPTLLEHLEGVPVEPDPEHAPFRFPVQYVIRPRTPDFPDYRGYAGQVAAGAIRSGDEITVLPSGMASRVRRIDTADGSLDVATAGQSVTLILDDDVDVARGDMIAGTPLPVITNELELTVCWLGDTPLTAGARVLVKHGTCTVTGLVRELWSRFDEQHLRPIHAPETLRLNDIGQVSVQTASPLPVDDYTRDRRSGACVLIDPHHGGTLAAGLIGVALPTVDMSATVPANR